MLILTSVRERGHKAPKDSVIEELEALPYPRIPAIGEPVQHNGRRFSVNAVEYGKDSPHFAFKATNGATNVEPREPPRVYVIEDTPR